MHTIAAISTPNAVGGIAVIRISGNNAISVAERIFKPFGNQKISDMSGYTCCYGIAHDNGERLDDCILTVFKAPHSYTGEDVVEISCHGGLFISRKILRTALKNGAENAEAGEFTKRAFMNGKLDLTQAEAVMDIISAKSDMELKIAEELREGAAFRKSRICSQKLMKILGDLAAWADYPEEDIPAVENTALIDALKVSQIQLEQIVRSYDNGRILKDGIDTVIAGRPNVGKSTLMNLLAGFDKSIVTSVAGTTRDIVEESVALDDLVLNLSDTAGIRETGDVIESIGVDKARSKLQSASLILCVFDSSGSLTEDDLSIIKMVEDTPAVAILNKSDLPSLIDKERLKEHFTEIIPMSAKNADGVNELIEAIKKVCAVGNIDSSNALIYNERQRSLTMKTISCVKEAIEALDMGFTLDAVTVLIEEAIGYLCELTGERVTDEVIDKVFHQFCVGK